MPVLLSEELKAAGSQSDPETFRELLADLKNGMYRNWTVEDLLLNPRDAVRYCNVVRERTGLKMLADNLILRTLLNMRKRAYFGIARGQVAG